MKNNDFDVINNLKFPQYEEYKEELKMNNEKKNDVFQNNDILNLGFDNDNYLNNIYFFIIIISEIYYLENK